jgi:hypothetical protein
MGRISQKTKITSTSTPEWYSMPTYSPSSLQSTSNKVFDKEGNALERIAQVMGMDVQNGLKV